MTLGQSKCVVLLFAVLIGMAAQAAAQDKIPIKVDGTTPDSVGTTYIYQLREQLKASPIYRLVDNEKDAVFHVGFVSMDPDKDTRAANIQTIASISLCIENSDRYSTNPPRLRYDHFLTHWVVQTRRDRVASSAASMIAAIDKEVQPIVAAMRRRRDN